MDALFQDVTQFFLTLHIGTVWAVCFGVLLLCGFGLPIPEDITLVLCGYMTYRLVGLDAGLVTLAVVIGLAGVLIGDGIMFTLGQRYGVYLVERWPFKQILGEGRGDKARAFLASNGPKVLFSARFMPGLRSVVFFTSGTLGIRLRTFLFYDGLAAMLSVPALILSAWYWGEDIENVIAQARKAEHGILLLIVGAALLMTAKWWWGQRKKKREAAAARRTHEPTAATLRAPDAGTGLPE